MGNEREQKRGGDENSSRDVSQWVETETVDVPTPPTHPEKNKQPMDDDEGLDNFFSPLFLFEWLFWRKIRGKKLWLLR